LIGVQLTVQQGSQEPLTSTGQGQARTLQLMPQASTSAKGFGVLGSSSRTCYHSCPSISCSVLVLWTEFAALNLLGGCLEGIALISAGMPSCAASCKQPAQQLLWHTVGPA